MKYPFRIKRKGRQQSPMLTLHTKRGNSVSIIDRWLREGGIWLASNGDAFYWLTFVSIMCYIVTSILQFIALLLAKNDKEKMFRCFSVLSFCGVGLLKLVSLKGRRSRWRLLLSGASALEYLELSPNDPMHADYESDGEEDATFRKHIVKYTVHLQSMSNVLSRIYIFTGAVFIMSPFLQYALWAFRGVNAWELPHILPIWAPMDKICFVGYIATVIIEGIAAIYCIIVHIAFDILVIGLMVFIHGQFLLLHDYCERIGGGGTTFNVTRERDSRAHYRISKCHRIHVTLIKSVNELSNLTQDILGIYFVLVTLTLCTVAVQFKTEQLSTTQLFSLLQYMVATLTQLFLFCSYGNAVIHESATGFGEGPFASAWWCLSPRIGREVALLCMGITRRCRLLAGPFHTLDLPAFILIVRTAYSYYALIRQKSDE